MLTYVIHVKLLNDIVMQISKASEMIIGHFSLLMNTGKIIVVNLL